MTFWATLVDYLGSFFWIIVLVGYLLRDGSIDRAELQTLKARALAPALI